VPGSKIEIKTSSIKGAGLGVYVTDNFVTGDFITCYEGTSFNDIEGTGEYTNVNHRLTVQRALERIGSWSGLHLLLELIAARIINYLSTLLFLTAFLDISMMTVDCSCFTLRFLWQQIYGDVFFTLQYSKLFWKAKNM
jgi:hypothetical protein